jgi:hypothetical protein
MANTQNDGFDDVEENGLPIDWDEADEGYKADAHKGAGETDIPLDDYLVRVGTLELRRGKKPPHRQYLAGQLCILRSTTLDGDAAIENAGMNIWSMFMIQGKPFSLRLTRQLEAAIGMNGDHGIRELASAAQDSTVRVTTFIEKSKQYGSQLKVETIEPATEADLGFAAATLEEAPFG